MSDLSLSQLQSVIEAAWEDRANLSVAAAPAEIREAVAHAINELDAGRLRVASREGVGQWTVHQWLKKAVVARCEIGGRGLKRARGRGAVDHRARRPL